MGQEGKWGTFVEMFEDCVGAPDEEGYLGEEEEGDDEPVRNNKKPWPIAFLID